MAHYTSEWQRHIVNSVSVGPYSVFVHPFYFHWTCTYLTSVFFLCLHTTFIITYLVHLFISAMVSCSCFLICQWHSFRCYNLHKSHSFYVFLNRLFFILSNTYLLSNMLGFPKKFTLLHRQNMPVLQDRLKIVLPTYLYYAG